MVSKLETMKLPEALAQQVTDIIKLFAGPCSIYVFGYRDNHFYLLVLSGRQVACTHLMNEISQRTNSTISTIVLLHRTQQLATRKCSQAYFFDQVLRQGRRLCLDTQHVPYVLHHAPERDLEGDTLFWHKCVAVAQFNIQAAKDSLQEEVTLCKVALLNTACVQLALGLIRVFLGYAPNEFGLHYLLQLCGHFTDLATELYNDTTEDGIRRYKMLCAPAGMLLHWTRLDAAEEDFEILLERSELFLKKTSELAQQQLNKLES